MRRFYPHNEIPSEDDLKNHYVAFIFTTWAHIHLGEDPGYWGYFANKEDAQNFLEEQWRKGNDGISLSDRATTNSIFFRKGNIRSTLKSHNYRDNTSEGGISAYPTKKATSMAGLSDKNWHSGRGIQVGTGSDGEPVIIPYGKWEEDISKRKKKVYDINELTYD